MVDVCVDRFYGYWMDINEAYARRICMYIVRSAIFCEWSMVILGWLLMELNFVL